MVGIFSRFSARSAHRRTQSALDERQVLPSNLEVAGVPTAATHGIEIAAEFKPVEHPVEPLDNDQPVECPLPEPSILNDGRIWKERLSASMRRKPDLPVMTEGVPLESEAGEVRVRQPQSKRSILPSASAPEHSILQLLQECNSSGN
uniref:Cystic fibrosis transmembrane conductance regulator n=1 Tax=Kalanchoe fedtschenkoi TaxID=63787 RepID=A0A7N0U4K0_KALFE